jgi:hypothetical protein
MHSVHSSTWKASYESGGHAEIACSGSRSPLSPHHPPGHLVLPGKINPRILPRQQQLDADVEDAGHLQGRDGAAALVVAQVVLLAGVVDRQAFLAHGCCFRQQLLLPRWIEGLVGLQGTAQVHDRVHARLALGIGAQYASRQLALLLLDLLRQLSGGGAVGLGGAGGGVRGVRPSLAQPSACGFPCASGSAAPSNSGPSGTTTSRPCSSCSSHGTADLGGRGGWASRALSSSQPAGNRSGGADWPGAYSLAILSHAIHNTS